MKLIQINLNRCHAAHDLLNKKIKEENIDIAILCEINKKGSSTRNNYNDSSDNVSTLIKNKQLTPNTHKAGNSYTVTEIRDMTLINCYISPNVDVNTFENYLNEITIQIKNTKNKKILIAGDLNCKAMEWGNNHTDPKGDILLQWIASLDLDIINTGDTPTFTRREQKSIIDVTLGTKEISKKVKKWEVRTEETYSDHNYIFFEIEDKEIKKRRNYNIRYITMTQSFEENIKQYENRTLSPEQMTNAIKKVIKMTSKTYKHYENDLQWWNEEITTKREACTNLRRKILIKRKNNQKCDELEAELKTRRDDLRREIRKSKKSTWNNTLEELNKDIWGEGYKIISNRYNIKTNNIDLTKEEEEEIVQELFPQGINQNRKPQITVPIKLFTIEEMQEATKKLKNKKAPGPDGITPEIIKTATKAIPNTFLNMYNRLLEQNIFPKVWKNGKLVLIEKKTKEQDERKKYRPLCLLNTMSKVYERLILNRIEKEITEREISVRQHGFRKGRSTITAMKEAQTIAELAIKNNKEVVIVTLDVKNAFNSAQWEIIKQIIDETKIGKEFKNTIQNYLCERTIQTKNKIYQHTAGVPQGSVLGPTLWNLLYNGVLELKLPDGTSTVGYADDLTVILTGKKASEIEIKTQEALGIIHEWMVNNKLTLETTKTEIMHCKGWKRTPEIQIKFNNHDIHTTKHIKYLGIYWDNKLNFTKHITEIKKKVEKTNKVLFSIMPNIKGPKENKRKMLIGVMTSIITYGAQIYHRVLSIQKYKRIIENLQRTALLRVSSAYRTTSLAALQVITGIIPIDLLIDEIQKIEHSNKTIETRKEVRINTIKIWQARWDVTENGKWTRDIIPDINKWLDNKGETNYYLTQVLTGHGCFQKYLNKIKKSNNTICKHCKAETDDVEHTLLKCPEWREQTTGIRKNNTTMKEIIKNMLKDNINWNEIKEEIGNTLKLKERKEIEMQKNKDTT